jgi:transposase
MAPNLGAAQHAFIRDMILSKSLTTTKIVDDAGCSERSVRAIRSKLQCFGTTTAPANGGGRPRSITPPVLEALREDLLEKPRLYLYEMIVFLWDEFEVLVTKFSIGRALASIRWSKKIARQVAKERNADLRDCFLHSLSEFRSYHLIYIDESGCDKMVGFRRTA